MNELSFHRHLSSVVLQANKFLIFIPALSILWETCLSFGSLVHPQQLSTTPDYRLLHYDMWKKLKYTLETDKLQTNMDVDICMGRWIGSLFCSDIRTIRLEHHNSRKSNFFYTASLLVLVFRRREVLRIPMIELSWTFIYKIRINIWNIYTGIK